MYMTRPQPRCIALSNDLLKTLENLAGEARMHLMVNKIMSAEEVTWLRRAVMQADDLVARVKGV